VTKPPPPPRSSVRVSMGDPLLRPSTLHHCEHRGCDGQVSGVGYSFGSRARPSVVRRRSARRVGMSSASGGPFSRAAAVVAAVAAVAAGFLGSRKAGERSRLVDTAQPRLVRSQVNPRHTGQEGPALDREQRTAITGKKTGIILGPRRTVQVHPMTMTVEPSRDFDRSLDG